MFCYKKNNVFLQGIQTNTNNMDWTSIIIALIGGGSIGGLITAIVNRHANKKIKESEAANADTEAQEKQMKLSEMYLEKVLKLTETGNDNQRQMMDKLDVIDRRTDKQDLQISNIEEYLNGKYRQWLANKENSKAAHCEMETP